MTCKFNQFECYDTRNGGTAMVVDVQDGRMTAIVWSPSADRQYRGERLYRMNGKCMMETTGSFKWDIVQPPPESRDVWINVYRLANGCLSREAEDYLSRRDADMSRTPNRVGCHRITLRAEFEEDA